MAVAAAFLATVLAASAYAGSAGRLDHSFGRDGQFVLGGFAELTGLDIGRKGRIVAAGNHFEDFVVARLRPNGRIDRSFADGGKATLPSSSEMAATTSLAIDRRGGVVLAGMACKHDESECHIDVLRLRRNGALNRRFGDRGMKTIDFPEEFDTDPSVALAPRRKIIVAASSCPLPVTQQACAIAVARLRANGSLDRRFGHKGAALTHFKPKARNCGFGFADQYENVGAIALDSRHRIVMLETCAGGTGAALARLTPTGNLDRSFGRRGKVYKDVPMMAATAIATDSRNRIDVAGAKPKGFAVARFRPNGKLDRKFGRKGTGALTFALGPRGPDVPWAVDVDSRGRIVAGGQLGVYSETAGGFARFTRNGEADRRFGHRGGAIVERLSGAKAAEVDSRDRVVGAGWKNTHEFKILRLLG